MMILKTLLFACIVLFMTDDASAQDGKEITIQSGTYSYKDQFPNSVRLRYPQFIDGNAFAKDGHTLIAAKFNYDFLNGQIVMIRGDGDTVSVTSNKIEYFKIGKDTYLNAPTDIIEIFPNSGTIKLGMNSKYIKKREERASGNGYTTGSDPTGAPTTRGPHTTTLIVVKSYTYYISIGGNVKTFKATRGKILKAFALKKEKVEYYIKSSKTDFKSRHDLEHLVLFLNSIIEKT